MTKATEKQTEYIEKLISSHQYNIGQSWSKNLFRPTQKKLRPIANGLSREQKKAIYEERRVNEDKDRAAWLSNANAELDSINTSNLSQDEASKTIDYLKESFLKKIRV